MNAHIFGGEKPAAIAQVEVSLLEFRRENELLSTIMSDIKNELSCCDDIPLQNGVVAAIAYLREQRDLLRDKFSEEQQAVHVLQNILREVLDAVEDSILDDEWGREVHCAIADTEFILHWPHHL